MFSEQSDRPVTDAAQLSQDAIQQQVVTFNQSGESYDTTPLPDRLVPVAERLPDCIAVKATDADLSYEQLLAKSERLAHVLIAKGVTPDQQVAVLLPRNSQLIISLLAVLRTGASYIPLDPEYPAARINYMLNHAQVSVLVADPALMTDDSWEGTLVNPAKVRAVAASRRQPLPALNPEQLAYVIYTSGSTGKPKGVMVKHGALTSFVTAIAERLNWPDDATTLGLTTVSFDIFVLEVFVTLLRGGTLVLASEQQQQDPTALARLIADKNVNVVQITPSRLQLLANATELAETFAQVERLLIGGEAFPAELLPQLQQITDLNIYNVYGPTEATVWASVKNLTNASHVSLGQPLANANAYVLNDEKQLMPIGSIGDLYLAGDCLANGYLFDQQKTDDAFTANPFEPGELMYRTGDLAAWNQDGELMYHGRNDHQVKLRGYRIELAEIDSVLNESPDVAQGAVVVRHLSPHNPMLVAFCQLTEKDSDHAQDIEAKLRQQLRQHLPDYMVPGLIIALDELPMTPNGKIDRNQLPDDLSHWQTQNSNDDEAQTTDEQDDAVVRDIRDVWQKLLGHKQISRHVSYFDVGGNSFSLMLMHNELDQIWPGLIHVTDIFANPTIGALATLVSDKLASQQTADYHPLTLPAEFFDVSANQADQVGQLLVEPGVDVSTQLTALASHHHVSLADVLVGLQGFFLHKRLEQDVITLYLNQPGKGYRPLQLDFSRLTQIEEIFQLVKHQREASSIFPVPPEADRTVNNDCLFLVRHVGDAASTQHKRFDFQLIIDDSDAESVALRVEFNHQRLSQQPVYGLINDYVRLSKAIIAASQEGLTS